MTECSLMGVRNMDDMASRFVVNTPRAHDGQSQQDENSPFNFFVRLEFNYEPDI